MGDELADFYAEIATVEKEVSQVCRHVTRRFAP